MLKGGEGIKTDPENIFWAPVSSCAQNHPKEHERVGALDSEFLKRTGSFYIVVIPMTL